MRKCTCDTDPLFYWTWRTEYRLKTIARVCASCADIKHPNQRVEEVFSYYNSGSTKAFKTLEELELYRIKQRL
jgi:hypothetical protein